MRCTKTKDRVRPRVGMLLWEPRIRTRGCWELHPVLVAYVGRDRVADAVKHTTHSIGALWYSAYGGNNHCSKLDDFDEEQPTPNCIES